MATVSEYSMRRDRDAKVSRHFRVKEFRCHDGSDCVLIAEELVEALEAIRAYYRSQYPGATITINSGYRTPAWNKRVGGARNSQHVQGTAADFTVRIPNGGIVSPYEVYKDIDAGKVVGTHRGGLGRYRTFTHIDVRGTRARWTA